MFIDTHAHLNFKGFKDDFDEVYKASLDANVGVIVNVGSNYQTSLEAVRKVHSGDMYAAVGVHPIHLAEDITETCLLDKKEYKVVTKRENFDYKKYQKLAKNEGVVAIGETGLDFFHLASCHPERSEGPHSNRDSSATPQNDNIKNIKNIQKDVFREHVRLAKEMDLPLILHCRESENNPSDAYNEMIEILLSSRANKMSVAISDEIASSQAPRNDNKLRGVIHCFVGNKEQAKKFLDMGFYIGVNGIVTFKNSYELQDIVRELPLESIVLETDCPFLAPDPYRGKRNEPRYIPIIAQKIAELKNINLSEVEEQTTANSKKLFNL